MSMMDRMSKEEQMTMMNGMINKFFADMTADDKSKLMAEMMPKMMEGENMMEMMPQMMMEMIPQFLSMMLPSMPKEKRTEFASEMVGTLLEQGTVGMSEEDRKAFEENLIAKITH